MSDVIYIVEREGFGKFDAFVFVDAYKSKNDAAWLVATKNSNANCRYHSSYRMKRLK